MVRYEHCTGTNVLSNLPELLDTMSCYHPARLQHDLQANTGLVQRLSHTQSLKGHSSSVNALDWSCNGEILLSGSDDCRVKLWSTESSKAVLSFDSVCHDKYSTMSTHEAHSLCQKAVTGCLTLTHLRQHALNLTIWACAGTYIKHICC